MRKSLVILVIVMMFICFGCNKVVESTTANESLTSSETIIESTISSIEETNDYPTITFNSNGGSVVASISVPANQSITKPNNPTRDNHNFINWFTDEDLLEVYTFSVMPEENLMLYAGWSTDGLNFNLINSDTEYEVTGGTPASLDIIIPTYYNEKPVTKIADNCFKDHTTITSVMIPKSIEVIGNFAFYECDSISNLTIPDGVIQIHSYAFFGMDSLASIDLPTSLRYLGDDFLRRCAILSSVTIPEGITALPAGSFHESFAIENVTLPSTLLTIGNYAFGNNQKITSIVIPNNVTTIGDYAFYDCIKLETITLPSLVTEIPYRAFLGCVELSFTIGSSITTIESEAFLGCTSLSSIIIPINVTTLGASAFKNCNLITINVIALEKPSGWDESWNIGNYPVNWGYIE